MFSSKAHLKNNAELPILFKYRYYVKKITLHRHVYSLPVPTTCPRNCSRAAALSRVRNGAVLSSSFGLWCGYHRARARNRFNLRRQFWSNSYTAKKTKCCRMNSLRPLFFVFFSLHITLNLSFCMPWRFTEVVKAEQHSI
jgi:hypothetical protein